MANFNRKEHWEKIYETKELKDVSWYQPVPVTSLELIAENKIPEGAAIIDIGGGDSLLVDHLLDLGYNDISVLDISSAALERAKKRLGERASMVKWIVADAAHFIPQRKYDLWHDRAAFHFLTNEKEIDSYLTTVRSHLTERGVLIIGTFSEEGPKKCSGIEIKQYSERQMSEKLGKLFDKVRCIHVDHPTPFHTVQNFIFCCFRQK